MSVCVASKKGRLGGSRAPSMKVDALACVLGWCTGQVVGALSKLGYAFKVSRKGAAFVSLAMRWLRLVRGLHWEVMHSRRPMGLTHGVMRPSKSTKEAVSNGSRERKPTNLKMMRGGGIDASTIPS